MHGSDQCIIIKAAFNILVLLIHYCRASSQWCPSNNLWECSIIVLTQDRNWPKFDLNIYNIKNYTLYIWVVPIFRNENIYLWHLFKYCIRYGQLVKQCLKWISPNINFLYIPNNQNAYNISPTWSGKVKENNTLLWD